MEYQEEDYLQLSGIQHFAFCRRQWALIHIEGQWAENERTVEGEIMHKRAHDPNLYEKREGVLISRGMPIYSRSMGVSGQCDIVEFHKCEDGIPIFGHRGLYHVRPVEYKKGKPKDTEIDILQAAAQAMCLEEMLSDTIGEASIYYGEIRRRMEFEITDALRDKVRKSFEEMHQLYQKQYTPHVKWSKSCNACSLQDVCLPSLGRNRCVRDYVRDMISKECEN